MSTVDLIPAPAADAVTFRQRRSRVFARMTVLIAAVWLLIRGVPLVVAVRSGDAPDAIDVEVTVVGAVLVPVVVGLMAALTAGRRGAWVRAPSGRSARRAAPAAVRARLKPGHAEGRPKAA